MSQIKQLILFILLLGSSCTKKQQQAEYPLQHVGQVVVDKNFQSISLNNHILHYKVYTKEKIMANEVESLLPQFKPVSPSVSGMRFLGNYKEHPNGWFYFRLINQEKTTKRFIIDEDNYLRCDGLEVFTYTNKILTHWGKVERATKLTERPIPFYTYAVPFTVKAQDTLDILIHTKRMYGMHEVNISVSSEKYFFEKLHAQFFNRIIEIIIIISCTLLMVSVGWLFRDRAMLYLSVYMSCILVSLLGFPGFWETITPNDTLGISRSGLLGLTPFLMNAMFHPYGIKIMERVPKNETRFLRQCYFLMGINILFILLFFLPIPLFLQIDYYLPYAMTFLSSIGIFWLFYVGILAYVRANISYFLVAVCFTFFPFIIDQATHFLVDTNGIFIFKLSRSSFVLSLVGLSIISIFQVREKLVSKKNYEYQVEYLRTTMENIRREDVESVGRNLHDNVGNTLATALGYLNLKTPHLQTVREIILDAINEIRFLSHNLVKNDELPISLKLQRLTERFNDFSPIHFRYFDYTENALDAISQNQQLNLYYIIQELFTNSLRHSQATEVVLQIFKENQRVRVTIEDDGVGLQTNVDAPGIGLTNMYKRAELAHILLSIDSTSQGTNTIIEVLHEDILPNH
ncbi:MAG: ATP-binding protein [Spirosomataceae bacterium]